MRRDPLAFAIEQVNARYNPLIEDTVESLRRQQGEAIIAVLRKTLARHNLKRHRVVICAAMGSAHLLILDRHPRHWAGTRRRTLDEIHAQSELISTLNMIEANLDYDWAYLFNGVELT